LVKYLFARVMSEVVNCISDEAAYLIHTLDCAVLCDQSGKLLEEWPGDGGSEVDVDRLVQILAEIL
jgi:hypothetical protein